MRPTEEFLASHKFVWHAKDNRETGHDYLFTCADSSLPTVRFTFNEIQEETIVGGVRQFSVKGRDLPYVVPRNLLILVNDAYLILWADDAARQQILEVVH